jgi:uncharacterized integral membrane protein
MKEYWQELTRAQKIKYTVSAISGILVLIFAIVNWKIAEVHLLITKVRMPITLLIVISLAGGFGLATLFNYRKLRKKDKEIITLNARLKPAEPEEEQI